MPRPPRKNDPPKPAKPRLGKPSAVRTPPPPRRPPRPSEPAFARAVLEGIADPMVVYDAKWRVRYENAAAIRVFQNIGRSSMLGRVLWTEFPDLEHSAFGREMRRAMEERVATRFTERRPGRWVWSEVHCYPLPDGGIAAVWRDITEQMRAERTFRFLARSNALFGQLLDVGEACNAHARLVVPEIADWCTISLIRDGQIRLVAIAHVDESKVALVRELDGRHPVTLDSDSRTARVIRSGEPDVVASITEAMIDAAFANPEDRELIKSLGFSSALTVPLKIGERILGAMSLIAASSGRGGFGEEDIALAERIAQRAAIAVDNARLYEEALAARAAAEHANAAKSAFLARMSHELRTPLNAIGGYADLLTMGLRGPLTPAQMSDVERIKRSQMHLLSLINDVLNYARVEAGKLHYAIRTVPVSDAVGAVEETFAPQFRERKLGFTVSLGDPALAVRADPERLQQILFNLVSNAVKFTPAGGHIAITAAASGNAVLIAVADTGLGIAPGKLESIFEPFVQLHVEGALAAGAGLGLAISRELAHGMDGDLTVVSGPAGSTFTVRLPVG